MKIITSATNVLRGLQNLSADEKFVIKADGSGLQKMSGWQSFKDFLGTRGAIRENRATIAALKGLIQNDPKYRGSSAGLVAQLDKLSASGLAVSGKFIKTMVTSLNAKTNLDIVRRAVANRLATIMADVSEGGEKTPLQELLDTAYGYLGNAMPKNDFQKALKKCVESQLTNELAQKLIADGTLPKGKDLSSVSMVLKRVLEHVLTGMKDVSEKDCGTELLARLKEQTVQDSTFEENLAEFFHRDDKVGFSTEASFGFSPPEALLNHEALENFNVSNEAFSRVYTLERQLGKTDEAIAKALAKGVETKQIPDILRLAHNPQFLTNRTAYLKGKAILANSGKSDQTKMGDGVSWAVRESQRLKTGFYKRTMGDAGLNDANRKLAEKFGMDVSKAPFQAVVVQLTRMSTHLAFDVFSGRLEDAEKYHIGKRPKDPKHPDVHLSDPPMGDLKSFGIENWIDPDILAGVLEKMGDADSGELTDKKKAVFVARVFNKTTLTELKNSKLVDGGAARLKRQIEACFNEAQAVVDAFKDDDDALDAFCLQMNYGSTLEPGVPLDEGAVTVLKAELENVKAWAQPLLEAGRPLSVNDLIKLCGRSRFFMSFINEDQDLGNSMRGCLPEMALGMYKTMSMRGKAGDSSAWKTIFQPKHLDRLVEGCAQFWDEQWRDLGGKALKKELAENDYHVGMCNVCNRTRAYLLLIRHLANVTHYAMGCDEGLDLDVQAHIQPLAFGMTVNTMKLPMPDCSEAAENDIRENGGDTLDERVFGDPALRNRLEQHKEKIAERADGES